MILTKTRKKSEAESKHTDNLKTAVGVHLSYITSAEPLLAVLIHKEVLVITAFTPVVAHGHVRTSDEDLTTRMRLVMLRIAT